MSDPFATLGLEPAFDLDLGVAEKRHRDLSKTLHPDRYAGRGAAERRQALGKAIEVNEAWRALRDPLRRAEALLENLGLAVEEGQEPKADPELLMDMMERREELASAARTKDADKIRKLVRDVELKESVLLTTLSNAFQRAISAQNGTRGDCRDDALRDTRRGAILSALGELRYYRRFLDEAAAFEDEL
jgi:molecular chaperone HscB